MEHHVIPAGKTISELEKQAADCEARAEKAPEPLASALREKAQRLRAWIEELRSGKWTAFVPPGQ